MYQTIMRISTIDLNVKPSYIEDLFDDVCDNTERHLYAFIGNDPVKAFYFALNIIEWSSKLAAWQVRLYLKELRYVAKKIEHLFPQITFWENKYLDLFKDQKVNLLHMLNYMLNNIIVDDDEDLINFALLLGANAAGIAAELKSEGKPGEEDGKEKEVV